MFSSWGKLLASTWHFISFQVGGDLLKVNNGGFRGHILKGSVLGHVPLKKFGKGKGRECIFF